MRQAAMREGGLIAMLCCLALCACAAGQSSAQKAAATPSPTRITPCAVQTPAAARTLSIAGLQTTVAVPGSPFASVASSDGQWLFVSIDSQSPSTAPSGIAVLRRTGSSAAVAHVISLSNTPSGEALTHDGRYLIVADEYQIAVLDVAKAEAGQSDAVLGTIPTSDPTIGTDPGTIEVIVSPDDQFVFATNEYQSSTLTPGTMSVVNLQDALADGFSASAVVGTVPLDVLPVGMALAPDGQALYVTSEVIVPPSGRASDAGQTGSLAVVDVQRAERDPRHAVVARVTAGCSPVRVALSPAGDVAWVTSRESNAVLAFATAKLASDPAHALLATAPVGAAPVGIAVVQQGAGLLIACSNRFSSSTAPQVVMLLNTRRALQGQPAVEGSIVAGVFPREVELAGSTALVTNYGSQSVLLLDTTKLPVLTG